MDVNASVRLGQLSQDLLYWSTGNRQPVYLARDGSHRHTLICIQPFSSLIERVSDLLQRIELFGPIREGRLTFERIKTFELLCQGVYDDANMIDTAISNLALRGFACTTQRTRAALHGLQQVHNRIIAQVKAEREVLSHIVPFIEMRSRWANPSLQSTEEAVGFLADAALQLKSKLQRIELPDPQLGENFEAFCRSVTALVEGEALRIGRLFEKRCEDAEGECLKVMACHKVTPAFIGRLEMSESAGWWEIEWARRIHDAHKKLDTCRDSCDARERARSWRSRLQQLMDRWINHHSRASALIGWKHLAPLKGSKCNSELRYRVAKELPKLAPLITRRTGRDSLDKWMVGLPYKCGADLNLEGDRNPVTRDYKHYVQELIAQMPDTCDRRQRIGQFNVPYNRDVLAYHCAGYQRDWLPFGDGVADLGGELDVVDVLHVLLRMHGSYPDERFETDALKDTYTYISMGAPFSEIDKPMCHSGIERINYRASHTLHCRDGVVPLHSSLTPPERWLSRYEPDVQLPSFSQEAGLMLRELLYSGTLTDCWGQNPWRAFQELVCSKERKERGFLLHTDLLALRPLVYRQVPLDQLSELLAETQDDSVTKEFVADAVLGREDSLTVLRGQDLSVIRWLDLEQRQLDDEQWARFGSFVELLPRLRHLRLVGTNVSLDWLNRYVAKPGPERPPRVTIESCSSVASHYCTLLDHRPVEHPWLHPIDDFVIAYASNHDWTTKILSREEGLCFKGSLSSDGLHRMMRLNELSLAGQRVTRLSVEGCQQMTAEMLGLIATSFPSLKRLGLDCSGNRSWEQWADVGLNTALPRFTCLEQLNLFNASNLSLSVLAEAVSRTASLRDLFLDRVPANCDEDSFLPFVDLANRVWIEFASAARVPSAVRTWLGDGRIGSRAWPNQSRFAMRFMLQHAARAAMLIPDLWHSTWTPTISDEEQASEMLRFLQSRVVHGSADIAFLDFSPQLWQVFVAATRSLPQLSRIVLRGTCNERPEELDHVKCLRVIKPTDEHCPFETRITVFKDVGWNNFLRVAGSGAGLSWDHPLPMKNVAADRWVFGIPGEFAPIEYKIVTGYDAWESGENRVLHYQDQVEIRDLK